jgi:hypothetical protein
VAARTVERLCRCDETLKLRGPSAQSQELASPLRSTGETATPQALRHRGAGKQRLPRERLRVMEVHRTGFMSMALALAVHLGSASGAAAEEAVVLEDPRAPALENDSTIPNRPLLRSGLFTLGGAYAPALLVAIESDRQADDNLLSPVVGPWLDLAQRDADCDGEREHETMNRTLRVADGVFQGNGALQALGSFVLPERQVLTIASGDGAPALSFTIMPTKITRGRGLVAMGKF